MQTPDNHVGAFLRLPQGLHQQLLEAAEHNLRSLNKEMIFRIQQTFACDDKPTQNKAAAA
jgi:Arc-like DNA binding domain